MSIPASFTSDPSEVTNMILKRIGCRRRPKLQQIYEMSQESEKPLGLLSLALIQRWITEKYAISSAISEQDKGVKGDVGYQGEWWHHWDEWDSDDESDFTSTLCGNLESLYEVEVDSWIHARVGNIMHVAQNCIAFDSAKNGNVGTKAKLKAINEGRERCWKRLGLAEGVKSSRRGTLEVIVGWMKKGMEEKETLLEVFRMWVMVAKSDMPKWYGVGSEGRMEILRLLVEFRGLWVGN
jgi:hypothetical protein